MKEKRLPKTPHDASVRRWVHGQPALRRCAKGQGTTMDAAQSYKDFTARLKLLISKQPELITVHDKIMRGNEIEGALWAMRALSTAGPGVDQTAFPCLPR